MLLYGDESEAPTHPCLTHPCLAHPCLTHPSLAHPCLAHPCLARASAKSGADMRVPGTRSSQKSGDHGITQLPHPRTHGSIPARPGLAATSSHIWSNSIRSTHRSEVCPSSRLCWSRTTAGSKGQAHAQSTRRPRALAHRRVAARIRTGTEAASSLSGAISRHITSPTRLSSTQLPSTPPSTTPSETSTERECQIRWPNYEALLRACCAQLVSYPAALKKLQHSSALKRLQTSPTACHSWS